MTIRENCAVVQGRLWEITFRDGLTGPVDRMVILGPERCTAAEAAAIFLETVTPPSGTEVVGLKLLQEVTGLVQIWPENLLGEWEA